MTKLNGWKKACIVFLFSAAMAVASPAQVFTNLVTFDVTNGSLPFSSLVQGTDGNLYGETFLGGANGDGTIFKITPGGTMTILHNFCSQVNASGYCLDGAHPWYSSRLVQATNGDFYGTADAGAYNEGMIFKITPAGKLTPVYSFCALANCPDGAEPYAGLVQASNGVLYGTTNLGGANGYGTIFKITLAGTLTTLYSFENSTDGNSPLAALVQASNGDFYGTTFGDLGSGSYGTIFEITPGGTLTTLHTFCTTNCADGENPLSGLMQATDGNFYGVTKYGGANGHGTVYQLVPPPAGSPAGTLGTLNVLYPFCSQTNSQGYCTDGANPVAVLVQGTDGNLYGTTSSGGAYDLGTVFNIGLTGTPTLNTLHSFCAQVNGEGYCTDGDNPLAGLIQATNGTFYGVATGDTDNSLGTVFSLSTGLGAFLETQPTWGKVNAKVTILGANLTGATGVSFNGTAATFTVVSGSEITTKVPAGATSGTLQVTTPSGALSSYPPFSVVPQVKSFTPTRGPVGKQVTIKGISLTQTTAVMFGGVAATEFTVVSDTEVTAIVPAGALTGPITITTLGGTATSTVGFTVN